MPGETSTSRKEKMATARPQTERHFVRSMAYRGRMERLRKVLYSGSCPFHDNVDDVACHRLANCYVDRTV